MTVRTRFAPSPTGYLHIGGARTALYSYLYARKHQGTFILRVEDTDRERSTDEAVHAILDSMTWLQLEYDEGPYYQTKRFDRYAEAIQKLLKERKAYRCYCSKERLEELRSKQTENKEKPRYDGFCRDKDLHDDSKPYVIRFKNPLDGDVIIDDQVFGKVIISNQELDDLIIARSDGTPTYNFTVCVDDWEMKITHVIRGDDHLNNTPRQINILKALGAELPIYAHVPMILGSDGKKLSKRHGAVSVMNYRDDGFLPQALLNYLVRLGWSYGDQEIFTMDEMINHFDLKNLNKAPAAFNPEKCLWLNQQYIKTSDFSVIKPELQWHMQQEKIHVDASPSLEDYIQIQRDRCKTIKEMAQSSRCFYEDDFNYDEDAIKKHVTPEIIPVLKNICEQFENLSSWNEENIHQVIHEVCETNQLKLGKVAPPIRIAVTGSTVSPSIDATLKLLGQGRTVARLKKFLKLL